MKINIFNAVEIAGGLFLLIGSLFAMYSWYGVTGVISLLVYLFVALFSMNIAMQFAKDKHIQECRSLEDDSTYSYSIHTELRDNEMIIKWMTVIYETPLSALIIIYVYYNVLDGYLYIFLFLLVSISWTKLRLGHSVFDRIAAHKKLRNDIRSLRYEIDNSENERYLDRLNERIEELENRLIKN